MKPCETCQAQLLHHLFGLLDDAEAADLQAHLAGCAACQAALKHTEEQQRLLATAAKGDFSEVQFRRPPATQTEPRVLPMPAAPSPATRRRVSLGRWAVAASLLVALSGSLLFGGYSWYDRQNRLTEAEQAADRLASRRDDEKARVSQEMHDVQQAIADIESNWRRTSSASRRRWPSRPCPCVIGPPSPQAGATNSYRFEVPREKGAQEPRRGETQPAGHRPRPGQSRPRQEHRLRAGHR